MKVMDDERVGALTHPLLESNSASSEPNLLSFGIHGDVSGWSANS